MVQPHLRERFGRRLQQLCRERGFTQERLADAVGLSVECISSIERGINGTSFDTLECFMDVLNVSILELFDFDNSLTPH